jgi:hypothetical protein
MSAVPLMSNTAADQLADAPQETMILLWVPALTYQDAAYFVPETTDTFAVVEKMLCAVVVAVRDSLVAAMPLGSSVPSVLLVPPWAAQAFDADADAEFMARLVLGSSMWRPRSERSSGL